MKLLKYLLLFQTILLIGCSKKKVQENATFDRRGKPTKLCSIRAGDGRGPYKPLGRLNERECKKSISKLCNEELYKQIHRTKGHFARGKYGERIMIGTCP
ncbi:hypothetical protein A9Q84_00745 [Halobacteriovorax marinus]|uniref:Lipoprotein n=1 Tax=Halobacteriovorax marinus TaxID=97084 RepID=A0A1Y5FBK6_9BACT|nr:hypothetical protein A9Q84_00745 [Halobacteriovorax marinus]